MNSEPTLREIDSRLKILWIDDEQPLNEARSSEIAACFAIERVWTPSELALRMRERLPVIEATRRNETVYQYPDFPFDGFLADFNLSHAGLSGEARLGSTPSDIPAPEELVEELLMQGVDAGLIDAAPERAEAAGLTSAVLAALNFATHPSVVVPYTGYPEHMARQRALVRLLAPTSIVISTRSEQDLSKEPLSRKLEQFATTYREHLPDWAGSGVVHITRRALRALSRTTNERADEDGKILWTADDALQVHTTYGRRALSCQSLWYGTPVTVTAVREWLDSFPTPTSDYEAAHVQAYRYAAASKHARSRARYTLSHLLEGADLTLPSVQEEIARYCTEIGLATEDVITAERRPRVTITRPEWTCPHLLALEVGREVQDLAILMLVVVRFRRQWAQVNGVGELRDILRAMAEAKLDHPAVREYINDPGLEELMLTLGISAVAVRENPADPPLIEMDPAPIQLRDMAQLIDPLPEQLLTADSDFAEQRIGKALARVKLDPPIGTYKTLLPLVRAMLADEPVSLPVHTRRDLQEFALDLEFDPLGWPRWLSHA